MIPAMIIFAVTYVLMLVFSRVRPFIALASGILFIIFGFLPLDRVLVEIDFNVLLMIAGTMGLIALFIESKMPALLADLVMERVPNVQIAAVALALFAGIISAFVDNVATVLMIAPVALEICKKLKTNPVPFIIAIAVSSNLQGAATLVGDTTAIMLGSAMDLNFMEFFFYQGKPSIFFAVELGAVLSALILAFLFRREKSPIPKTGERTKVTDPVPSVLLCILLALLVAVSFAPDSWNLPDEINGIICCALMVIGLAIHFAKKRTLSAIIDPLKQIDYETLGLLLGLFLMIGGLEHTGVIAKLAELLAHMGGGNIFLLYTVIVWASVLISAFIDNIPYVATMIPVIGGLAIQLSATTGVGAALIATPLYFGLLSGATLGGNITPIGASANITSIGILRRQGYEVKNRDFFKIGIPFTVAAIVPAYIYIWLVFGV
ncbi:MAG: arsenic transporter [Ruminococcaceae bacterium]|nr:arsenic transporter [Oscillospiraceae bacterium]